MERHTHLELPISIVNVVTQMSTSHKKLKDNNLGIQSSTNTFQQEVNMLSMNIRYTFGSYLIVKYGSTLLQKQNWGETN